MLTELYIFSSPDALQHGCCSPRIPAQIAYQEYITVLLQTDPKKTHRERFIIWTYYFFRMFLQFRDIDKTMLIYVIMRIYVEKMLSDLHYEYAKSIEI